LQFWKNYSDLGQDIECSNLCHYITINITEHSFIYAAFLLLLLNSTEHSFIYVAVLLRLILSSDLVPRSPAHVTFMIEAIHSSESSALTRTTRRNISEDSILLTQLCVKSRSQ
jgi:hypothetical protein